MITKTEMLHQISERISKLEDELNFEKSNGASKNTLFKIEKRLIVQKEAYDNIVWLSKRNQKC